MLTQTRVVRDASFIGMKAYSRGTHAFTKEDNLHYTYLCKGWAKKIIICQPQPQKKVKERQKFNHYEPYGKCGYLEYEEIIVK